MSLLTKNHSMLGKKTPNSPAGATNSFNSSTVTLTPSRTPAAGILLFAAFGGVTARTISTEPSGWTQIGSTPTGSGCVFHYYKVAGGSEPANYTWTLSGATNGQWVFLEIENAYEIAYHTESVNSATGTSFPFTTFDVDYPSFACASYVAQASSTITQPTNYTKSTLNFRHELAQRSYFNVPLLSQTPTYTSNTSQTAMIKITIFKGLQFI